MKKIIFVILIMVLTLSGCAKKEVDIDNLPDTYTSVISMPYNKYMGQNISEVKEEIDTMVFDSENNLYYINNPILEFTPFLYADENDIVKITGFEGSKKVDENTVSYIKGLYNMMCSYYGSVKIDPDIKKRVNSINDMSMCKNGENYKEVWNYEGFPVEYYVSFDNDKANIKIQYNKYVNIKK